MPTSTLITVLEADTILGTTSPWSGKQVAVKNDALGWAQVYFLDFYSCPSVDYTDVNNIDASIKEALALLANEHLTTDLYARQDDKAAVSEEFVKVDVIEKRTKYAQAVGGKFVDPFPNVTGLVSALCSISKGSGMTTSPLLRQ